MFHEIIRQLDLFLDTKEGADPLGSPLLEKKREATMDFAANIEKVREVDIHEITC